MVANSKGLFMEFLKKCEVYLGQQGWNVDGTQDGIISISKPTFDGDFDIDIDAPKDFGHYKIVEISRIVDVFDYSTDIPKSILFGALASNVDYPVGCWVLDHFSDVCTIRYSVKYIWDSSADIDWEFIKMSLAGVMVASSEYEEKDMFLAA